MQGIVDAHIHLIEPDAARLGYAFATTAHPLFGGVVAPPDEPAWTLERLEAEPADPPVRARVHVQCADAAGDPVIETRFVAERAGRGIQALVVRAPLLDPGFEALVERHVEVSPLVRGVRDMTAAGELREPSVDRALAVLEAHSLSWDAHCLQVVQLGDVLALARRHPDLVIVLTHAGLAFQRSTADFEPWRRAIVALAEAPNVNCKLSGLGIGDHAWSVESWRPWVLAAVDAFGPDRCLFGSNWPVDRLFSSYQAVLDAYAEILSGLSETELDAIFGTSAARVYRL
jgi:predicted TIM-barrel fold metal-dependent hydrolase